MKSDSITKALTSSYLQSFSASILALISVPLLLKMYGPERYAVIGLLALLQSVAVLFDLGAANALGRRLALLDLQNRNERTSAAPLLRTYEALYVVIVLFLLLIFIGLSPWMRTYLWKGSGELPEIGACIIFIGLIVALRMILSLYTAAYIGMRRQSHLNWQTLVFGIISTAGGILAALVFPEKLIAYFIFQLFAALAQLAFAYRGVWQDIAAEESIRPDFGLLRDGWTYSMSMWGTSLLGIAISQADKLVLVRCLALAEFSFYTVASSITFNLYRLINPITAAFLPKLTKALFERKNEVALSHYRNATNLMSTIIGAFAVALIVFGKDLIPAWLHRVSGAGEVALLSAILAVGVFSNSISNLPYMFQMAAGNIAISFRANIALAVAIYPILFSCASLWGARGSAAAWSTCLLVYCAAVTLATTVNWRSVGLGKRQIVDVFAPVGIACVVALAFSYLWRSDEQGYESFARGLIGTFCTFAVTALANSSVRRKIAVTCQWIVASKKGWI